MNWLFDNPLANMPGTWFLLFYAVAIVAALIVYRAVKSRLDRTARKSLPPIPHEPDPFEIAILRGGANELARSAVFDLMQKGFLQINNDTKKSWIERTPQFPHFKDLKALENSVFQWFCAQPREPKDLFAKGGLTEILQPFAATYEARLRERQFLTTEEMKMQTRGWALAFATLILGLGGYKLISALLHAHSNVGFLIVMAIGGTLFLLGMSGSPRVTALGRAYLERLQLAFERLKYPAQNANAAQPLSAGATFSTIDPMLLSVGLFGAGVLAGTAFDSYNQAFYKAQQQAAIGSSCGSGCGTSWDSSSSSDSGGSCSSGDGGSSCGGGCGGCGGGCS